MVPLALWALGIDSRLHIRRNGWTYGSYEGYIRNQFSQDYGSIVNSVNNALDAASSYFTNRQDAFQNFSISALEEGVASWLNSIAAGTSPLCGPFILINNPQLYPGGSGSNGGSGS